MFHYKYLSTTHCNSLSITRKKDVTIPKHRKTIYEKNSIYTATKYFNTLPNHLRELKESNKTIKRKIMNYLIAPS